MNDIDTLMLRIDEINAKSPADLTAVDIDNLVSYHRQQRARKESGIKRLRSAADTLDDVREALLRSAPAASTAASTAAALLDDLPRP